MTTDVDEQMLVELICKKHTSKDNVNSGYVAQGFPIVQVKGMQQGETPRVNKHRRSWEKLNKYQRQILSCVVAFKMVESFKIALPRRSRQLLPLEFLQTVGYTLCESIYELI